MANRDDDRDYERERQNYGRRSESEYGRSYGGRAQGRYRYGDNERESERYGRERGLRDEYSGRYSPTSGRRYESGGEGYRGDQWQDDPDYRTDRDREYGGYGRSYSDEGRYSDRGSRYSQRYNYPTGFRSGESYGGRERPDYERVAMVAEKNATLNMNAAAMVRGRDAAGGIEPQTKSPHGSVTKRPSDGVEWISSASSYAAAARKAIAAQMNVSRRI